MGMAAFALPLQLPPPPLLLLAVVVSTLAMVEDMLFITFMLVYGVMSARLMRVRSERGAGADSG